MDDEIPWSMLMIFAIVFGLLLFGIHSYDVAYNSPENQKKIAAQEKACATPILVAEKDGVKLYAINYANDCDNRVVYFSSAGTHTTHRESHGKTSTEVDDDVVNTGDTK